MLGLCDPAGTGDKARIVNDLMTVQLITEPDRPGLPQWGVQMKRMNE